MKKTKHLLWLFSLVSAFLAIAAIRVNLLFPEWVILVFALIIIIANIVMWIRLPKKYIVKSMLSVFGILAIAISLFESYCNPYWNSVTFRDDYGFTKPYDTILTYPQAKHDLDFAFHYLKKLHPAFYHADPQTVEEGYKHAVKHLQEAKQIDVSMLAGQVEGIFSTLHDGHTTIIWNDKKDSYLKNFDADSLIAVNGMSMEEMLKHFSDKVSYDADSWGIMNLRRDLSLLEGLHYLGIAAEDGVTYTYETLDKDTVNQVVYPSDFIQLDNSTPYSLKGSSERTDFVSANIDKAHNLAVLTLTQCTNNEEYQYQVKSMFSTVKRLGIQNVAVDLRHNGGGNSDVINEFLKYIDVDFYKEEGIDWRRGCFLIKYPKQVIQNEKNTDLLFHGNLYLLTSSRTFSSAMLFAQYVKDNHLGTIIGEPPGNDPNGYGDIATFVLPESGILLQISTKHFHRIDDSPGLIQPDIPCSSDQVLDKLYEQCGK